MTERLVLRVATAHPGRTSKSTETTGGPIILVKRVVGVENLSTACLGKMHLHWCVLRSSVWQQGLPEIPLDQNPPLSLVQKGCLFHLNHHCVCPPSHTCHCLEKPPVSHLPWLSLSSSIDEGWMPWERRKTADTVPYVLPSTDRTYEAMCLDKGKLKGWERH